MIKKLLVVTLAMMFSVGAFAQSELEENLQSMLSENATLYLQPLGDAFGAAMNSGWYHRSRVHKMLGFDISAKMMVAAVPEESEYFNFVLNENQMEFDLSDLASGYTIAPISLSFADIYKDTETQTPTIFGPDSGGMLVTNQSHLATLFEDHFRTEMTDAINAEQPSLTDAQVATLVDQAVNDADIPNHVSTLDLDLPLPPGIGLPALPLAMPQIALGLPMGIELTLRGFPEQDIPDIGLFSMYGAGARVNIDQFIPIPLFPVDITAGAFYSQMQIGDIIESSNTSVSLQVGKSLNLLIFGVGVYADAAYESSSLSIGYDADFTPNDPSDALTRIQFDMETDPGLRVGAGLHLTLIPLTYFNVHVSKTPNNQVLTGGFGISFR